MPEGNNDLKKLRAQLERLWPEKDNKLDPKYGRPRLATAEPPEPPGPPEVLDPASVKRWYGVLGSCGCCGVRAATRRWGGQNLCVDCLP